MIRGTIFTARRLVRGAWGGPGPTVSPQKLSGWRYASLPFTVDGRDTRHNTLRAVNYRSQSVCERASARARKCLLLVRDRTHVATKPAICEDIPLGQESVSECVCVCVFF